MDNDLLYSVEAIRAIERSAAAELPPGTLMKRAGEAAARFALELLRERHDQPVLVLAGPGNNGGDGLEVAANLRQAGLDVMVLHLAASGPPSGEATAAMQAARASGARFIEALPHGVHPGLVVDGLFGIGLARGLDERCARLAGEVATLLCPVLALDVPSGLDADTGAIVGSAQDGSAVRATHTITFIANKPGLYTAAGRDFAGEVRVETLGIDRRHYGLPVARINGPELFMPNLAHMRRNHDTHKGSYGDVAIVGGAKGMAGAPILAARAALFAGAGRVFVASIGSGPAYDPVQPELMFRDAATLDFTSRTLVVGPGMGDSDEALHLLMKAVDSACPLVIDADALTRIAGSQELQSRLAQRKAATVITPHPLEAARLLGVTAPVVQADRLEAARELTQRLDVVVVLKGSGTIIAHGKEDLLTINDTGNPGLATAGTGDVLAGLCGALLVQGWPAREAALGSVWLHGAAADAMVDDGIGPIGMTAGELPFAIRAVINAMVSEAAMP